MKIQTRKIQAKIPQLELHGRFLPESFNEADRTVEMVFTTSAPTRMYRWKGWDIEEFNEVLSMEKAHIRLERMLKGAPLLDNHNRCGGVKSQIGVVVKAWPEGEELRGIVRFSKRTDVEPIFQDVKDGIIRNGSIGYRVHKYEDISNEGDKVKTLRAVDWEPVEMSLVPVPADHNAQVRSEAEPPQTFDCEIVLRNSNERKKEMNEQEQNDKKPALTPDADAIRTEERQRNAKILSACRRAKLPEKFAEELIKSELSYEQCLEQIQEKWAQADAERAIKPAQNVKVEFGGNDETVNRREGAAEAILARHFPAEHKPTDRSRKFQGRTAVELCRLLLEQNGVRTDLMNVNEIVERAFHSTSDLSNILENVASKRLQKAYESVPQVFRNFGVENTLKDFKQTSVVHLGEVATLEKITEGAEIKMGTVGDSKEVYQLATYAKGLAVTRKAIINDDLGALGKAAAAFGRSAAHLENTVALKEAVLDNPTMGDAVTLFHANHSNLDTGGALSETRLSAMKALLRKQKDDKSRAIGLVPKYLLVGADIEDSAKKLIAAQSANGGYNVHAGMFELLVSPLLNATEYYVIADPNMVEGLEYAYLEGARGIQIETKDHPETLGVVIRAYLDFAAKVINYRAFVKNAGA